MKGMVRIIAAALFAVCVTAALAGCSFRADETGTSDSGSEQRSDVSSERSVPEQSAPEDSSSRTEDSDGASTSAPEQPKPPKDTSEPVGSVPEQSDPPEESAPESNPESEPEPSDEPEPADLPDCAQLYAAAVAGTEMPPYFVLADIPDTAETDENTAPLSIAYPNLDTAQLEDFYATMPKTIVNAAEAAVFLPADRDGRNAVLEAIEARVADQKRSWEHYLQDQYELVEDYQVAEKNGYILYVVAEDADRIVTQFIAAVK